jgi:hypothetical protein
VLAAADEIRRSVAEDGLATALSPWFPLICHLPVLQRAVSK